MAWFERNLTVPASGVPATDVASSKPDKKSR
jgi:hypothetical protein